MGKVKKCHPERSAAESKDPFSCAEGAIPSPGEKELPLRGTYFCPTKMKIL
jgi:hypothetical protein